MVKCMGASWPPLGSSSALNMDEKAREQTATTLDAQAQRNNAHTPANDKPGHYTNDRWESYNHAQDMEKEPTHNAVKNTPPFLDPIAFKEQRAR